MPKGDSKVEKNKKQNTCMKKSTKKKTLKNKSSKSSSKPAQEEPAQKEAVQKGPPAIEVVQKETARRESRPPIRFPLHVEPIPKKSPFRKDKKKKSNMPSEMAGKEPVLTKVALVPVRDSQLLKEDASTQDFLPLMPQLPKESLKEEASKNQKLFS